MNIRQLRYFVQIYESGSLAKASRQLYIAQPALTQQIARLEGEVGRELFMRSARGVLPTENGRALYDHAKFLLKQFDQALAIARQDTVQVTGRVSVGLASTTVCALGLPLVRHLRTKFPGVVLNVVEGMSGHLEQMMQVSQLDMAILFTQAAAFGRNVEPLLDEELFVILPADSDLVAPDCTGLPLAEVARLPLILPTGAHGLRRRIALEFERLGMNVQPVAEIDSLRLLMSCIKQGMGATIKPMSAGFALNDQDDEWRTLPILDVSMTRRNYLYTLEKERLSPCAAFVRDELKFVVRQLITEGTWRGVSLPPPEEADHDHAIAHDPAIAHQD